MHMIDLYIRFIIVTVGSSVLAWLIIKHLNWHNYSNVSTFDLLASVIAVSATCGFAGIVLVDLTRYAESAIFYWGAPITIGFVFGVVACRQLFLPPDND